MRKILIAVMMLFASVAYAAEWADDAGYLWADDAGYLWADDNTVASSSTTHGFPTFPSFPSFPTFGGTR